MDNTHIDGRVVKVSKPAEYIYMLFADLTNFTRTIPEDILRQYDFKSTVDTITANVSGFEIGIEVVERTPFSRIGYCQSSATPLAFSFVVLLKTLSPGTSEYQLILDAEIPAIYKMMIGGKVKEMVDRVTDEIERGLNSF